MKIPARLNMLLLVAAAAASLALLMVASQAPHWWMKLCAALAFSLNRCG